MSKFGQAEREIRKLLSNGNTFVLMNETFEIIECGKPTCGNGEPKTDVYVLAKGVNTQHIKEIKISFKKENADFIENKTNAERAEALLGQSWKEIICQATGSIREKFVSRTLIYKDKLKRTEAGAITLGWKFELLNKLGGELSQKINLSREQIIDVYAGTSLCGEKRDANVNGKIIKDSGIANYLLMNDSVHTTQNVIDSIISIEDYVNMHPNVYFACKALNYRTFKKKWDGDRPLAVSIVWKVENGKLIPYFDFNNPLIIKGNEVANRLIRCLEELNIDNTNEINENNIYDFSIVNG